MRLLFTKYVAKVRPESPVITEAQESEKKCLAESFCFGEIEDVLISDARS